MIKEVSKFIAGKTSFIVGDTLQVGHRTQDAPDQCNVVLESAGGGLHFDLPDKIDKMIQVISRAKTYFEARDDAWAVFNILHGKAGYKLDETYWVNDIEALADPQYIGQDEKGRYEFSVNYIFRIQNL